MTANIVLDDGISPADTDAIEAPVGSVVTYSNFDDTGVLGWQWVLTDIPAGSTAVLSAPTGSTGTFTVDVEGGTYLVSLVTYTDVPRTLLDGTDSSAARVRFVAEPAHAIPAATETTEFHGSRGWAEEVNAFLRKLQGGLRALSQYAKSALDPAAVANRTMVYSKEEAAATANTHLFARSSDGGIYQLTSAFPGLLVSSSLITAPGALTVNEITRVGTLGVATDFTLPALSTVVSGQHLFGVYDENGSAGSYAVTITPNGAETINGVNAPITLTDAYGVRVLIKTSATNWALFWSTDTGASTGGGGEAGLLYESMKFLLDMSDRVTWPGSGTTVTEILSGRTGSLSGAAVVDNYLEFTPIAGAVTINKLASADDIFATGGTVSFWCRRDSAPADATVVSTHNAGATTGWRVGLVGEGSSMGFVHGFSGTEGEWDDGTGNAPEGWFHCVVTYDASSVANDPIFYMNAVNEASVDENSTPVGTFSSDAANDVTIGNRPDADWGWDGAIDLVQLHDTVWTPAEVDRHYRRTRGRYVSLDFPALRSQAIALSTNFTARFDETHTVTLNSGSFTATLPSGELRAGAKVGFFITSYGAGNQLTIDSSGGTIALGNGDTPSTTAISKGHMVLESLGNGNDEWVVVSGDPTAITAGATVIFDSGATDHDNVYSTLEAAVDACALIDGPVDLFLRTDASVSGWTRSFKDINLIGDPRHLVAGEPVSITFTGASTITNGLPLSMDWVEILSSSSASLFIHSDANITFLTLRNICRFAEPATDPIFDVTAGGLAFMCDGDVDFNPDTLRYSNAVQGVISFYGGSGRMYDGALLAPTAGAPALTIEAYGPVNLGSQATFTGGGGALTEESFGNARLVELSVVGPTTLAPGDRYVECDTTSNAVGVTLSTSNVNSLCPRVFVFDEGGNAETNNISVTTGGVNYTINTDGGGATFVQNGSTAVWVLESETHRGVVTLTSAANVVAVNAGLGTSFKLNDLAEDTEIQAPTNAVDGDLLVVTLEQDGTGGRAVTFAAGFVNVGQLDPPVGVSAKCVISIAVRDFGSGQEFAYAVTHAETTTGLTEIDATVQTTDATVTTIATFATLTDDAGYLVDIDVAGIDKTAGHLTQTKLRVLVYRNGSSVLAIADTDIVSEYEDDATWEVTVTVATTVISIKVQGDATNNTDWRALGTVLEIL